MLTYSENITKFIHQHTLNYTLDEKSFVLINLFNYNIYLFNQLLEQYPDDVGLNAFNEGIIYLLDIYFGINYTKAYIQCDTLNSLLKFCKIFENNTAFQNQIEKAKTPDKLYTTYIYYRGLKEYKTEFDTLSQITNELIKKDNSSYDGAKLFMPNSMPLHKLFIHNITTNKLESFKTIWQLDQYITHEIVSATYAADILKFILYDKNININEYSAIINQLPN